MSKDNKIGTSNKWAIQKMTVSALLISIGLLIPLISPLKIVVEPISFTLASHVAIFIAMMIDPAVAIVVALGTALGFFLSFPIVIALRALSHVVFAAIGSFYLKRHRDTLDSLKKIHIFSFVIALIHAFFETVVVFVFYFGTSNVGSTPIQTVLLFIGLGSVIHSMVDFEIAYFIYKPLSKQRTFSNEAVR